MLTEKGVTGIIWCESMHATTKEEGPEVQNLSTINVHMLVCVAVGKKVACLLWIVAGRIIKVHNSYT